MTKNTGGPAFPGLHPSKDCQYKDSGMTLRDHFAGLAMQGLIVEGGLSDPSSSWLSEIAYDIADAMLAEREKEND